MRIVHLSDWHGHWCRVPEADLYLVTGDMLPDFWLYRFFDRSQGRERLGAKPAKVDEILMSENYEDNGASKQIEWGKKNPLRPFLGSPEAPIVLVRGNHDRVDLGPLIASGEFYEVSEDSSVVHEVKGLRIGGMRGINYIGGAWADEFDSAFLNDLVGEIPTDIDVLVTHAPPRGIMDFGYGIDALRSYHSKMSILGKDVKLHAFGHVHGINLAQKRSEISDITIFSNAACGFNVVDI